jgi:gamma-glutamyl hydrolase
VLFPGGGGDYNEIGQLILKEAIAMNDAGKFFPIWGTCLGFERLSLWTADKPDSVLEKYGSEHHSLPIKFKKTPLDTKMYCEMGLESFMLEKGNYTYNSHEYSVDPKTFETDAKLSEFWDVTAISHDASGREFVASIEAKNYPFMAT